MGQREPESRRRIAAETKKGRINNKNRVVSGQQIALDCERNQEETLLNMTYPVPSNETQRIAALAEYQILDTVAEKSYDELTSLAAYICEVPLATISFVDTSRQWFKSRIGIDQQETPREIAFCAHAIVQSEPLIVRDARKDERFANSPLVTGNPHIRFYAGFPLTTEVGLSLGALCAIDHRPRRLSAAQTQAMEHLSHQVMALLELRRVSAQLAKELENVRTLQGMLPICAWCKRIRDDGGYWSQVDRYIHTHTGADFTHGICPECLEEMQKASRRS
jgi:GAF domain-containing protein